MKALAVSLDPVVGWPAAMALHPHVVDRAVVSELSPPPPVVVPIELIVGIVAYETSVNAREVGDVVAGQGQADQRETRPSRRTVGSVVMCPGGCQPDCGQHRHQAPLPPDSIAAQLAPSGLYIARDCSTRVPESSQRFRLVSCLLRLRVQSLLHLQDLLLQSLHFLAPLLDLRPKRREFPDLVQRTQ